MLIRAIVWAQIVWLKLPQHVQVTTCDGTVLSRLNFQPKRQHILPKNEKMDTSDYYYNEGLWQFISKLPLPSYSLKNYPNQLSLPSLIKCLYKKLCDAIEAMLIFLNDHTFFFIAVFSFPVFLAGMLLAYFDRCQTLSRVFVRSFRAL